MTGGQRPEPDGRTPEARASQPDGSLPDADAAAAADATVTDEGPLPAWVPTQSVIDPYPERQVLVVGTTPTGLLVDRLFRAAGYDPVVLSGDASPPESRSTYLPPASVEVLGALGLADRLLDHARPVTRATVRQSGEDSARCDGTAAGDPDRAPPVVVPTAVVYRVLRGETAPTDDRGLGTVSPGGDGVEVVFDDGVREWFDLVVDAGGAAAELGRGDPGPGRDALVQYEAPTSRTASADGIEEAWSPDAVVQRVPRGPESSGLVRITTPETDASRDQVRRWAVSDSGDPADHPDADAFDRTRVWQVRLPDATVPARWWGDGRIARCGPAACPAAPAAGMGAALGFTDALGVVRAIANGGDAVPDAVDAYATNRARRLTGLRRDAASPDRSVPGPTTEPLASLAALRTVALRPFFGTAPAALRTRGSV